MSDTNSNKAWSEAIKARRELEAEIAGIDDQIKDATHMADLPRRQQLQARKKALPDLYIEVSMSERHAADGFFGAQMDTAAKVFGESQEDHRQAEKTLLETKMRHQAELNAATESFNAAERRRNTAQAEYSSARSELAERQQGYAKALANLAGA